MKATRVLMWVFLAVIFAGLAIAAFYFTQNGFNPFGGAGHENTELQAGFDLMTEGRYDEAIAEFNALTEDGNTEAAKYAAQCYYLEGNIDEFKNQYTSLLDQTGDQGYAYQLELLNYGCSPANAAAGGNVLQYGADTYILWLKNNLATIYRENTGGRSVVTQVQIDFAATDPDLNGSLNISGNTLYYILGGVIYSYNLQTGESASITDTSRQCSEMIIYGPKIYYVDHLGLGDTRIWSCDLNGGNRTIVYDGGFKSVERFIIGDGQVYLIEADQNGGNADMVHVDPNSQAVETIFSRSELSPHSLFYYDKKIYFSALNVQNGAVSGYSEGIYQVDPANNTYATLSSPGAVASINTDGSTFYYISNGLLYRANMDLSGATEIGEAPSNVSDGPPYTVSAVSVLLDKFYNVSSEVNTMLQIHGVNDTIWEGSPLDQHYEVLSF